MKICIWLFTIEKINFDNYGHLNLVIVTSSPHYRIYSVCVINCSLVMYTALRQPLHGSIIHVLQTRFSNFYQEEITLKVKIWWRNYK